MPARAACARITSPTAEERAFFLTADDPKALLGPTRMYDELVSGRSYVQSDPLELDGGISTYAYVESHPLTSVDAEGSCTYNTLNKKVTYPVPPDLMDKCDCTEKCLGIALVITGGSEPHGSWSDPHALGSAVDFSDKRNPRLPGSKQKFYCCAKGCGFTFAWHEPNGYPSTKDAQPHYHLESPTRTRVGNELESVKCGCK